MHIIIILITLIIQIALLLRVGNCRSHSDRNKRAFCFLKIPLAHTRLLSLLDADLFSFERRPFFLLSFSIRLLSRVYERVPINRRALTSTFNGCRYLGAPHA